MTVIVAADSPIVDVAGLKGKLLAMPGAPSVAEWLVWQMALAEGWGKDGVRILAQGSVQANVAALLNASGRCRRRSHRGRMAVLTDQHKGRIVVQLARYAPHFHSHIIFARKDLIRDKPDLVERFLKGFFASIAFMKAHKAGTSETAMRVLGDSRAMADRTYDYEEHRCCPTTGLSIPRRWPCSANRSSNWGCSRRSRPTRRY